MLQKILFKNLCDMNNKTHKALKIIKVDMILYAVEEYSNSGFSISVSMTDLQFRIVTLKWTKPVLPLMASVAPL